MTDMRRCYKHSTHLDFVVHTLNQSIIRNLWKTMLVVEYMPGLWSRRSYPNDAETTMLKIPRTGTINLLLANITKDTLLEIHTLSKDNISCLEIDLGVYINLSLDSNGITWEDHNGRVKYNVSAFNNINPILRDDAFVEIFKYNQHWNKLVSLYLGDEVDIFFSNTKMHLDRLKDPDGVYTQAKKLLLSHSPISEI